MCLGVVRISLVGSLISSGSYVLGRFSNFQWLYVAAGACFGVGSYFLGRFFNFQWFIFPWSVLYFPVAVDQSCVDVSQRFQSTQYERLIGNPVFVTRRVSI